MNSRNREVFIEEANELLGNLESTLLDLEKSPESTGLIGSIFRSIHTIKGSGAMFGFDRIASFTHDIESVFDLIRNGKMPVSKELIDLTLAACDEIRNMIDASAEISNEPRSLDALSNSFREMLKQPDIPEMDGYCEDRVPTGAETAPMGREASYRIRFRPEKNLCVNGTNPLLLLAELQSMGPCTIVAQTNQIPILEDIDPELCYAGWEIALTTDQGIDAVRDVFIFVEGNCDLQIERIDVENQGEDPGCKKIGRILIERGDIAPDDLQKALESQERIGEILVKSGATNPEKVRIALAEQDQLKEVHRKRSESEQASSIRVPAEKLDKLVNMVGELVTVQSRLTSVAMEQGQPKTLQVAEEVARLVADLRDLTMSIRMVPIGTIFNRFNRLARDLAVKLKKEIAIVMDGSDTELDKTVIERLNDPLVHLIRNSIDHGVESPDVRESRGKSRQGTISISAIHSGANVLIQIKDDGAGLDSLAIREKALEKGLISADAVLSEHELQSLIFHPGFSTARSITDISGRGVGMDVVKQNIEALQGNVDIASEKGVGTTISLRIPLTLVIIDGLLVEIGANEFVMPLAAIEECVELRRSAAERARGRNLASIRGEFVPYIDLRNLLRIPGDPPEIEQIVTAVIDKRRIGFVVDRVIGQHQTVIKSLGRVYQNVEEISGATILGNGKVALIFDLGKLVKKAERIHSRTETLNRVH